MVAVRVAAACTTISFVVRREITTTLAGNAMPRSIKVIHKVQLPVNVAAVAERILGKTDSHKKQQHG
jgi:hypothetical protein